MRYLDVCAGISASSVAWKPLGWEAAAYSEIEPAPRAILAHRQGALPVDWDHRHVPGSNITPLFGDFTQIEAHHVGPIDLLVGGTPCQDFSVAGLRAGLDGDRGNLSLEFLRLADRTRPRWLVWENVPGVLSIDGGKAFGAILGGMGELGYGFAYRILDAQHFGVPQRRRRVFVVGYLGDHRRAGAVLFERHSLSGHSAPRRQAGKIAPTIPSRSLGGGGLGTDFDCDGGLIHADVTSTLPAGGNVTGGNRYPGTSAETCSTMLVAHSLRGEGFDASEDGTGRGTPIVPVSYAIQAGALRENPGSGPDGIGVQEGCAYTLEARAEVQAVAFGENQRGELCESSVARAMQISGGKPGQGYPAARIGTAVRRLTPRECERLQGFPDYYTLVPNRGKPMADGPRYKALGNSMAVPVMRWIGERIAAVDALKNDERIAA